MKKISFIVMLISIFIITFFGLPKAKEVLDEEFGPGGSKVELVKAKVRNGVLTLAVRYVHPWEAKTFEEKKKLDKSYVRKVEITRRKIPIKFKVEKVFYIANGKRYYVLKDKNGQWLASPVVGDYIADAASKTSKKGIHPIILDSEHPVRILWFKFPAPPEGIDEIEFQIPGVAPFDVEIKR